MSKELEEALWTQMEWAAHYADLMRSLGREVPERWRLDRSAARKALQDAPLAEPICSSHPWHARPLWQKRAQGWISYQFASWASLVWPIEVDRAMHHELNKQFENQNAAPGEGGKEK